MAHFDNQAKKCQENSTTAYTRNHRKTYRTPDEILNDFASIGEVIDQHEYKLAQVTSNDQHRLKSTIADMHPIEVVKKPQNQNSQRSRTPSHGSMSPKLVHELDRVVQNLESIRDDAMKICEEMQRVVKENKITSSARSTSPKPRSRH